MKIVLSTLPKEGSAVIWISANYFTPDYARYVPLGILSLASNVPEGHEVKILDPRSENWSIDRTVEEIEKEKPDILGLSTTTVQAYPMMKVLQRTSAPYKVVGGPHSTNYAETILRQGANAVFVGQLADLEFAEAVKTRPKGIVRCKTDINQIRFPDRKFIDVESYYSRGNLFESNRRMVMFSGVGCPHNCIYCDVQTKLVQRRTPKLVLDEMIYLRDMGAGSIHVYEDNFNTDERYLKDLCAEMDKRKFHSEWSGRGQARMSLETAKMLSDRGFKRIHVGIESLSDKTLRWFRKPQNYAQIRKFCQTMHDASIDVIGFFIVGAPTETEEDKRTMLSKIRDLGIKHSLVSILQPVPDTDYYRELLKNGTYEKDYWGEYIQNPTPNFMIPFPNGREKWQEDADFITQLIEEFKKETH